MKTLMLCSDMRSENWTVIQKSVQMLFEEDSECHRASRHPRLMITLTSRSCDPRVAAAISGAINTRGQGLLCFIDYIFCWTSFCLPPHRREKPKACQVWCDVLPLSQLGVEWHEWLLARLYLTSSDTAQPDNKYLDPGRWLWGKLRGNVAGPAGGLIIRADSKLVWNFKTIMRRCGQR